MWNIWQPRHDYQQMTAYQAEFRVSPLRRLDINQAKARTLKIVNTPYFYQTMRGIQEANNYAHETNVEAFKVRKGKITYKRSAACTWHYDLDRGLWASVLFASNGVAKDISELTIYHELAHYLSGPNEGHCEKWAATYIALTWKEHSEQGANELLEAFDDGNVVVDSNRFYEVGEWLEIN